MAALRHLSPLARRWLILFAVTALCARALVPAGWMPVAGPQGTTLAFCDGAGPMPAMAPMASMASMKHAGMPMGHHHGAPDHPCDFAAAAAAFTPALPFAPPPAPTLRRPPAPARTAVAIGRGLAAPPPPSTGPPAFA